MEFCIPSQQREHNETECVLSPCSLFNVLQKLRNVTLHSSPNIFRRYSTLDSLFDDAIYINVKLWERELFYILDSYLEPQVDILIKSYPQNFDISRRSDAQALEVADYTSIFVHTWSDIIVDWIQWGGWTYKGQATFLHLFSIFVFNVLSYSIVVLLRWFSMLVGSSIYLY